MVKSSDEFVNDCIPKHCSACLSFNVFNVSVARVITIRLFSLFRLLLAKNLQISFLARFLLAVYFIKFCSLLQNTLDRFALCTSAFCS